MAADILVVDDEQDIRDLVAGILEDEGYETRTASDSDNALAEILDRRPSLVFLDIWLQGSKLDGLDLLDEIKATHAEIPVVMISGHGNIETAVSAIKRGAYEYIEKPLKADRLVLTAERALEAFKLRREVERLGTKTGEFQDIIGNSVVMNQLRSTIEKVAPTNSRIMIMGPSGSGKELVARTIHKRSLRREGPFVVLSSATITPDRFEEALFGAEARPGHEPSVGALEEAHGGTLFLDEIGDMPMETQGRILRVLVAQEFTRVGGSQKVKVDVRIVGAANADLPSLAAEGRFREDLLDRLSFDVLTLPPLRYRQEDILPLAEHFAKGMIKQLRQEYFAGFTGGAAAALMNHEWPGNIRELKNVVERAVYRAPGGKPVSRIEFDPFASPYRPQARMPDSRPDASSASAATRADDAPIRYPYDFTQIVADFEAERLRQALEAHQHHQGRTADALGLSYDKLRGLLRKHQIGR